MQVTDDMVRAALDAYNEVLSDLSVSEDIRASPPGLAAKRRRCAVTVTE